MTDTKAPNAELVARLRHDALAIRQDRYGNQLQADDMEAAAAALAQPAGEPVAWSTIRSILEQGAAIQQDYMAGKYANYEEYSARLDAAARERVPPALPEGMVTPGYRLVRADVLAWLHGERAHPDTGEWFERPDGKGAFWWRSKLRAATIGTAPADAMLACAKEEQNG